MNINIINPLVSVVMPNFNGERFIEDSINSVLNQDYKNIELIIVDDKSTDNSIFIIKKMMDQYPQIILLQNENNMGVSRTRNRGIDIAKGKYIALIDNDDLWEQDKISQQIIIAEKGVDIVYCSYDLINENGMRIKRPFIVPVKTNFKKMLTKSVISCSTAFIRSGLLKDNHFSSEYYHEDFVLWLKLLKQNFKAEGTQKILAHYRIRNNSRSNKKINSAKERWKIFHDYLGYNTLECCILFVQYSFKALLKYI